MAFTKLRAKKFRFINAFSQQDFGSKMKNKLRKVCISNAEMNAKDDMG